MCALSGGVHSPASLLFQSSMYLRQLVNIPTKSVWDSTYNNLYHACTYLEVWGLGPLTIATARWCIISFLNSTSRSYINLSLSTQRYDTKEINLKPGVDPKPYLTQEAFAFKGHMVTISQQRTDTTKVTFRNVPWDIPDEELINYWNKKLNSLVCFIFGNIKIGVIFEPRTIKM